MTLWQVPGAERRTPDQMSESRAGPRSFTVYRVARILRSDDAGLWRVRNLSDRGMLLEANVAVVPNERLEIALSETVILSGRIVWSNNGRCAVAFDDRICTGDVLRKLVADREADNCRPLRLSVCCPARLLMETNEHEVTVTSISQFGLGFAYEGELREDARADLMLQDGVRRNGNIRWLRDGTAGLQLACPFALSELESVRGFA